MLKIMLSGKYKLKPNDIHLYAPTRITIIKKDRQYKHCENMEKLETLYIAGGNVKCYSLF